MGFSRQEYQSHLPISFSRESSWPRDQTLASCVSCTGRQVLYHWASWEAHINMMHPEFSVNLLYARSSAVTSVWSSWRWLFCLTEGTPWDVRYKPFFLAPNPLCRAGCSPHFILQYSVNWKILLGDICVSGTVVAIGDKAVSKMDWKKKQQLYFMGLALVCSINKYK